MACVTADSADDACREVLALGAVVLAVTNLTAVLASLVLIVSEGTVEGSQLTKLVTLELVLTFGDRGSLRECQYSVEERFGMLHTVSITL